MMIYKPYSIVIVPFPFSDKVETKRRPALVISSIEHQKETDHVTLMMITSAQHSVWEGDYPITQLADTGLHKASVLRQKLFTIDARLVMSVKGKLGEKDLKKVKMLLKKHLMF